MEKKYIDEYEQFVKQYEDASGSVGGAEIGFMIAKMTHYFCQANLQKNRALKVFNAIAREVYNSMDGIKPITAAKADRLVDATPEAAMLHEAQTDVTNLEQIINSLKSLQKGVISEYTITSG